MKYWHEESREVLQQLADQSITWEEIMHMYEQPDWCDYPKALSGGAGCWSLVDWSGEHPKRECISLEFCKGCDCCKIKNGKE